MYYEKMQLLYEYTYTSLGIDATRDQKMQLLYE